MKLVADGSLTDWLLTQIPPTFKDDGASWAPDQIMGVSLRPAARVHDWLYCTRAHPPGSMTRTWKKHADRVLRREIRALVPGRIGGWVASLYFWAVSKFGGPSFNTCGPDPKGAWSAKQRIKRLCRHNLPEPLWMKRGLWVAELPTPGPPRG